MDWPHMKRQEDYSGDCYEAKGDRGEVRVGSED